MVVGVTASTVVSTTIQTRLAIAATASREMQQVAFVEMNLQFLINSAVGRNPATLWTEALLDDSAFRSAVGGASLASPGSVVAICDRSGRVVVAANTSRSVCPSGRPLSEIGSVGVVDVVTNSRLDNFVSSHTLVADGNVVETRVKLDSALLRANFVRVLVPAVFFGVVQLLAVGVVATVVSWIVFRRS
jgi:hypothetical protein